MRSTFFLLLFLFAVAAFSTGCSQESFNDVRISGDMTTGIGIGHGVRGGSRVTTGIDF